MMSLPLIKWSSLVGLLLRPRHNHFLSWMLLSHLQYLPLPKLHLSFHQIFLSLLNLSNPPRLFRFWAQPNLLLHYLLLYILVQQFRQYTFPKSLRL